MTTTPLPPLPKSSPEQDELFDHLYEYGVSAEGVHQRLEKVCQAYATQARADLEAENQQLREALEKYIAWCDAEGDGTVDFWERVQMCRDSEAAARSALEQQP